jgi:uncharacterized repeat protein (TIGR03803 family)
MKIGNLSKWLFLLPALITGFGWVPIGQATAQTFTTLYNFTLPNGIYTTTNSDGWGPVGGLISSGSTLYGTTEYGGSQNWGTVYAINTNGTGFTILHSLAASDGEGPQAGLILSGNILYGTTIGGGTNGSGGTVFAVHTNGTGFTTLHSFTAISWNRYDTNSDGAWPTTAGLILSGTALYGTTYFGASSGNGTVFALNTDGTGFTNLYDFPAGNDQGMPNAVILSSGTLYGTTYEGGTNRVGSVFALKINGTGFTILHSFAGSDGGSPLGGLILSGNTLYGTTAGGGTNGTGTVFAVNTDGTGFTNLHSFTATSGGVWGGGTVFSLSPSPVTLPQLTIVPSGPYVILTWPTNTIGFTLQSTTSLGSSAVWSTNSLAPVVVNGQNTVTNPITGTQQFFRLSQ